MESEKACNERDRQGETGPPTDNDCAEWAVTSNWVVCLVNVCADQKANNTAVPAKCLPSVSEGRGISQTGGQAREQDSQPHQMRSIAGGAQQVVIIIIMWKD